LGTVIVIIGNYRVLQQWIYEFCYPLGMPLKFHYRRRILIGPKRDVARQSVRQRQVSVDPAMAIRTLSVWPAMISIYRLARLLDETPVCRVQCVTPCVSGYGVLLCRVR
jgi:hypothetical protein